jgi:hypothetical protein
VTGRWGGIMRHGLGGNVETMGRAGERTSLALVVETLTDSTPLVGGDQFRKPRFPHDATVLGC